MARDDWRVTVELREREHTGGLRQALAAEEVDEEARRRLGSRVVVSEGDGVVFLYTATQDAAHEAGRIVRELTAAHGFAAEVRTDRWHPVEERWEDERVPLPATDAQERAEHERLEDDEIAESEELGAALWEVRVELASHGDAVRLAERLSAESDSLLPGWTFSVRRRWRYLLIGVDNEDQASEVARRLKGLVPPDATIHVEPSGALAWNVFGNNPFAIVRDLGG